MPLLSAALAASALLAPTWGAPTAPVSSDGNFKQGMERATIAWARTAEGYAARFDMALKPGWHTYWQNPGDSGDAPTFKWTLPAGCSAQPVRYPRPEVKLLDELPFFGYEGSATYVVEVHVASAGEGHAAPSGTWEVTFTSLICKDICVRGEFVFKGSWPPSAPAEPVTLATEPFSGRRLPQPAAQAGVTATMDGDTLVIEGPAQGQSIVRFVPEQAPGLTLAGPAAANGWVAGTVAGDRFTVRAPLQRTPLDDTGKLPDVAGIVLLGTAPGAPHVCIRVPSGAPASKPSAATKPPESKPAAN
jgi:DsbC/DsbD-like thiol-disulfide interchange protein